jgi:uncharacterized protein
MRTSSVIASTALLGAALLGIAVGLSPAISFDGTRAPEGTTVPLPDTTPSPAAGSPSLGSATPLAAAPEAPPIAPLTLPPRTVMPPTPQEAFRSGTQLLRQGKTEQAIMELEYAAEQGVSGAIWKLGRMYADGDGVKANKARAYEYFRRLTTMHGDDSAGAPNARFVANAFVTLGLYYLDGIPGTLKADSNLAREMFRYAASYFADPEAQYHLGRLYLLGKGAPKDSIQAARWLRLSANKGDHRAQALLGSRFRAKPRSGCSGSSLPKTPPGRMKPGLPTCTRLRSLRPMRPSGQWRISIWKIG